MLPYVAGHGARLYPVEVSGWDDAQNFFVEKCELIWNEESGKRIRLSHGLREKTIVFVRLLQSNPSMQAHPVAYEVEALGESQNGLNQFRLKMVAPRLRTLESTAA